MAGNSSLGAAGWVIDPSFARAAAAPILQWPDRPIRLGLVGDSFAQRSSLVSVVTAATASAGIITCTATSHGRWTGDRVTLAGAQPLAARVKGVPITRIDANTFSVPAPGVANGTVAATVACRASGSFFALFEAVSEEGLFCHLQRISNSAFDLVHNSGHPGHTVTEVVALWDEIVTPYQSALDLLIIEMGYNSLSQDESASAILAAYESAIGRTTSAVVLIGIWPVVSGTSGDTAARLQTALTVNRGLRDLCAGNPRVRFVNPYDFIVNAATGYAASGMILGGSDNIHPAPRGSFSVATQVISALPQSLQPQRFVTSINDNVAVSATNPNIARNGMVLTTSGGSDGGLTATAPADETTAVAGGAGANWAIGTVSLASGNVFVKPASSGFGNAQCLRATADAAADQGRVSLTLTNSDIVLGRDYDLTMRVRLTTAFNASNKTPAAQNVRALQTQAVFTVDGNTYTFAVSNPASVVAAGGYLTADGDWTLCARRIPVPAGIAVTLIRIDAIMHFDGAGVAQVEVSNVSLTPSV